MRRLILLILVIASVSCFSQDIGDDYIYGMGRGKSAASADSSAMVALSMSIRTNVVNTSRHTVTKIDKEIGDVFERDIRLTSSVELCNTENKVYKDGDEYIVYRYFNKKEYVESQMEQYNHYMEEAEKIKGSNIKHEKNLLLGNYYLAYKSIDTYLMDVFGDVADEKENLIKMTRALYHSSDYGRLSFIRKKWNGFDVSMSGQIDRFGDTEPIELIGFEYLNSGKWEQPVALSEKRNIDINMSNDPNNKVRYRRGLIKTNKPQALYRVLYEKYENGRYIKISVPDEWYFSIMEIDNPMFLS